MLDVFNIAENAPYMSQDDWETLWRPLSSMALMADVNDNVPSNYMNVIEKLAFKIENKNGLAKEQVKDEKKISDIVKNDLFGNPEMQTVMIEMAEDMQRQFMETGEFPLPMLSSQMAALRKIDELPIL